MEDNAPNSEFRTPKSAICLPLSQPLRQTILLGNPNGLHMRPSAAFVELAGRFQSSVVLHYEGKSADGKSMWDLIGLAVMPGAELTVEVAGPDAAEAMAALAGLLRALPNEV
jgi:phosphotransferase system HPr (HPr) family protein